MPTRAVHASLIANGRYAASGRRLVDPALPEAVVRWFYRRLVVAPVLHRLGIALAFVSPRASIAVCGFGVAYDLAVQNTKAPPPSANRT